MSQVEAEQGEPSQRGAGPVLEPQSPSLGDSGQQSRPLISPSLPLYERERGCMWVALAPRPCQHRPPHRTDGPPLDKGLYLVLFSWIPSINSI